MKVYVALPSRQKKWSRGVSPFDRRTRTRRIRKPLLSPINRRVNGPTDGICHVRIPSVCRLVIRLLGNDCKELAAKKTPTKSNPFSTTFQELPAMNAKTVAGVYQKRDS